MSWIRSLIFNTVLFGFTAVMCLVMAPALLLPREKMLWVVHLWLKQITWIERNIGGITYRIEGRENIPEGACIIASKHQSAWETFKLHLIFGDPAIVLKKELLSIPIWGWYLQRSGMIPIDRKGRAQALMRMMETAHRAAAAGRKIVIFPQGTRVKVGVDAPYKSGIAALYQELRLPIVPMALNSGLLWPKNSFIKKPGLITVQFLPPIPADLVRPVMMDRLKTELENATEKLVKS